MTERAPIDRGVRFERIEVGTHQSFQILLEKFREFPVAAPGSRSANNFSFDLLWPGGYGLVLPKNIRLQVREAYLSGWEDKTAPRSLLFLATKQLLTPKQLSDWGQQLEKASEQTMPLNQLLIPDQMQEVLRLQKWGQRPISEQTLTLKQLRKLRQLLELKELPTNDRKPGRKDVMPFPGVLMTYRGFRVRNNRVSINTRVGNYAELDKSHPDFMKKFPGHKRRLQQMIRGIGVQVLTETSDNFHIFGLVAKSMGEGSIGTMGITPGISDKQMESFIRDAEGKKRLKVPGSWLFDAIEEDLSEPDELNLQAIPGARIESSHLLGIIPDPNYGWMTLIVFCKLNASAGQIEGLFGTSKTQEHKNLIFVNNDPHALSTLLLRPGVYPTVIGGYHAYFKQFHPELLKP